ncbi:MAG: PfkB family carbohydrate kinase [Alphaproteobacteria bacterium]|nr:PfkB family carbohydrate kinase [Alphaproteobacteria bacterium]
MTRFLVLGGAHLDRRATLLAETRPGASNPGHWYEEPGGGGFNAAQNLSRLGNHVQLVSVRGGDQAGEAVAQAAEAAGIIDMAQVFLDRATPSYSAILEHDRNLLIGVAHMDLYDHFSLRQLSRRSIREALEGSDQVLCDANLPQDTLAALAAKAADAGKPLAAIAISPAKVIRLSDQLPHLSILFMNEAEATTLSGDETPENWPTRLRAAGLQSAIITRGAEPLVGFDPECVFQIATPPVTDVADVTGAGDALAAATLNALHNGTPLPQAARAGIAAASITIQCVSATAAELNDKVLDEAMALVPEPDLLS